MRQRQEVQAVPRQDRVTHEGGAHQAPRGV
ncbi:hypothetical protein PQQ98_37595 [Paraburkholderia azotifigens]